MGINYLAVLLLFALTENMQLKKGRFTWTQRDFHPLTKVDFLTSREGMVAGTCHEESSIVDSKELNYNWRPLKPSEVHP